MDDHQCSPEIFESEGELARVCAQIVLQCLYFARIGRPDLLARPVTKWIIACDKKVGTIDERHQSNKTLRTLFFFVEIAMFQINFRRSVLRIDLQQANSRVSQQFRIRNDFVGCRFEKGRYTSIAIMGLCLETCVALRC